MIPSFEAVLAHPVLCGAWLQFFCFSDSARMEKGFQDSRTCRASFIMLLYAKCWEKYFHGLVNTLLFTFTLLYCFARLLGYIREHLFSALWGFVCLFFSACLLFFAIAIGLGDYCIEGLHVKPLPLFLSLASSFLSKSLLACGKLFCSYRFLQKFENFFPVVVLAVRFLMAVRNIPKREAYKSDLKALLLRLHLILNPANLTIRSPDLGQSPALHNVEKKTCQPRQLPDR